MSSTSITCAGSSSIYRASTWRSPWKSPASWPAVCGRSKGCYRPPPQPHRQSERLHRRPSLQHSRDIVELPFRIPEVLFNIYYTLMTASLTRDLIVNGCSKSFFDVGICFIPLKDGQAAHPSGTVVTEKQQILEHNLQDIRKRVQVCFHLKAGKQQFCIVIGFMMFLFKSTLNRISCMKSALRINQ